MIEPQEFAEFFSQGLYIKWVVYVKDRHSDFKDEVHRFLLSLGLFLLFDFFSVFNSMKFDICWVLIDHTWNFLKLPINFWGLS